MYRSEYIYLETDAELPITFRPKCSLPSAWFVEAPASSTAVTALAGSSWFRHSCEIHVTASAVHPLAILAVTTRAHRAILPVGHRDQQTWGPEAFARRTRTKIHNFGAPLPPWENKEQRPTPAARGIPKSINIILLGPTGEAADRPA